MPHHRRRTFPKNIPEEHSRRTFPGVANILPKSLREMQKRWPPRTERAIRYFQYRSNFLLTRRTYPGTSGLCASLVPNPHRRKCIEPKQSQSAWLGFAVPRLAGWVLRWPGWVLRWPGVSQGLTTGFGLPGERPTQPSRPQAPPRPLGEPQMPGGGLNQKTVTTCGVFVTLPGETTRCCPCTTDPHCYPASALARPTKGRARAKSTSITHTHPT